MPKQSISCTLQVAGCRLKKIFTSIILASCILHLASFNLFAAPHITRGKPEPQMSKVGMHLSKRMAAKFPASLMAPTVPPSPVDILFLRVDFKNETSVTDWSVCYSSTPTPKNGDPDPNTTGLGIWNDPSYAQPVGSVNYDHWINQAAIRFPQYFTEVSYSNLVANVTVSPVYSLANPMCYYRNEVDSSLERLAIDAVAQAQAASVDFSQYGAVVIVHAGAGEETDYANDSARDIWSLYYSTSCIDTNPAIGCQPLPSLKNGEPFNEFIVMPQTGSQDDIVVDPLGVYVHEFGHWLGLPDLYPTNFNSWDGPGKWSLMADGIYLKGADNIAGSSPSHPDAWCKTYLRWVTPQLISTDNVSSTLLPVETNQQIIKVPASTTAQFQYFLLENRQQTGFDSGLPGSGLLVWLIDEAVIYAPSPGGLAGNTVNNNPVHPGVALMEADGNNALKNYNDLDYGSASDPFPGSLNKTLFTPYTNPSSTPYSGSAWLYLKDIATAVPNVSVTIGFAPAAPSGLSWSHNSATVLTWTAGIEADLAYRVYRNGSFLSETTQAQYTDSSSASGDKYTVSAVDINGYESARSASVTVTFSSGAVSGGGGGCFIATAAFGSYEAPYVRILREFRDSYLLTNGTGKAFVRFYYKVSPPVADFIRESEGLKAMVRVMLLPLIGIAAFLVKTSLVMKLTIFGVAGVWVYKRKKERPQTPSLVKRGCRQAGS